MARALTLRERVERKIPRVRKFSRQWLRVLATRAMPARRPVFVVGSQRSGTRLPLAVMDRSPDIITYSEGSSPFFDSVLLKGNAIIARHLRRIPFPVVVLKPICESHRVPDLLASFSGSTAIWIFRDYRDTVNSAVLKWQTGRRHVRDLAAGDVTAAGWRAGGLTPEKLALVRELYSDDMSLHAADAVMWYLRNSLFFDLDLAGRPDVLLVKYEDLALDPGAFFPRVFDFLGCPFDRAFLADVFSSSVKSKPFPRIPSRIESLCDEVYRRLTACYGTPLSSSS